MLQAPNPKHQIPKKKRQKKRQKKSNLSSIFFDYTCNALHPYDKIPLWNLEFGAWNFYPLFGL